MTKNQSVENHLNLPSPLGSSKLHRTFPKPNKARKNVLSAKWAKNKVELGWIRFLWTLYFMFPDIPPPKNCNYVSKAAGALNSFFPVLLLFAALLCLPVLIRNGSFYFVFVMCMVLRILEKTCWRLTEAWLFLLEADTLDWALSIASGRPEVAWGGQESPEERESSEGHKRRRNKIRKSRGPPSCSFWSSCKIQKPRSII